MQINSLRNLGKKSNEGHAGFVSHDYALLEKIITIFIRNGLNPFVFSKFFFYVNVFVFTCRLETFV